MNPKWKAEFERLHAVWRAAADECFRHGHDHSHCGENRKAHEAGERAKERAWNALMYHVNIFKP